MDLAISNRVWSDPALTTSEKMVLLALDNLGDRDGFSWWGLDKLAEMTGISLKSKYLTKIINKLETGSYLLVWRQHGKRGGRGYTHIYWPIIGRSDSDILEIITRRFAATENEARTIISQNGLLYQRLVKNDRISGSILEQTRDIKKGVISTPIDSQKGVLETPKEDKGYTEYTHKEEKGVLDYPRSNKDSLKEESNPSKESNRVRERVARAQEKPEDILERNKELALRLISLCGYQHPKFVVNGKLKECAEAITQLVEWDITADLIDEFPAYWWGTGPPTFRQVVENWGKFLEWRASPPKKKEARTNGHKPTKDHRPEFEKRAGRGYTKEEWDAMLRG